MTIRTKLCLIFGFVCFCGVPVARSQSIFDAPSACAYALKQDWSSTVRTSSEQMAYLNTIDEKTFEQIQHDMKAGELIPIPDGIVKLDQSYSDFDQMRRDFFQQIGFTQSKQESENILNITTSARAYASFDKCMDDVTRNATGFSAWRISEDKNDVVLDCYYVPPPGGRATLDLTLTVDGGTFAANHKTSWKTKVGTNSHCDPITILRAGSPSTKITIGASGFAPVVISSQLGSDPPKNSATVLYTPLERIEETKIVYDQRIQQSWSPETKNMDGKGGCVPGFPAILCSTDGRHQADSWGADIAPPSDGDFIDQGQAIIANGHWVTDWNQTGYCAQYVVSYYPTPQYSPGQASPELIAANAKLRGKHFIHVEGRCWSLPSVWIITAKMYHLVPSETPKSAGSIRFNPNQDFIFSVPDNAPGKLQLSYADGTIETVKPGDSTSDRKIVCKSTFRFNGNTYYVYRYMA